MYIYCFYEYFCIVNYYFIVKKYKFLARINNYLKTIIKTILK